jgi:HK97 family phage portal protein
MDLGEWLEMMSFNGNTYPAGVPMQGTLGGKEEKIATSFIGHAQSAYASDGVVFACMLLRMRLFSEVRFQFRKYSSGRAGELFGNRDLAVVEEPFPGGTTGDLASRAIQDADLSGNWFLARRPGKVLRRLRPDCVTIVMGSKSGLEIDKELVGYVYEPKDGLEEADNEPLALLPSEVVHWAPIPDPFAHFRGMSWLTPVTREIMGDKAMTQHSLKFFEHGATPNLVVKVDPQVRPEAFDTWVDKMEENSKGLAKAYKTMYLGGGSDATVVGANMKQVDFSQTRGSGETRIAAAAGTPPVLVGLSEGLKAATYSNYQSATRQFADGTLRPLWRSFCGTLAPFVKVPADAELWYDDRDIAFLKEDAKDAVEIQNKRAETIGKYILAGYEPTSVVEAVEQDDLSKLVHTGYVSVQMWIPGEDKSTHAP